MIVFVGSLSDKDSRNWEASSSWISMFFCPGGLRLPSSAGFTVGGWGISLFNSCHCHDRSREAVHKSPTTTAFAWCQQEQASSSELSAFLTVPTTAMGKGLGSTGGATLERSKLDLKRQIQTVQPRTDDAGGGGDIGKSVFNGGGGGGDDDDDDDDYYDDGEDGDGDGDDGFFRKVLPQLYDRVTISAVLEEWFRSFTDLPIILRRAVEMGLFSSAQLVRFCSMDVRPGLFRNVSRKLPVSVSKLHCMLCSQCLLVLYE